MQTKRTSRASSARSKQGSAKTTPLGQSLARGLKTRVVYVPEAIDVRAVREESGLSQSQFAERYGFNPRTLQDWEQGRAQPDSAVRAYLKVISRNPHAVEQALR